MQSKEYVYEGLAYVPIQLYDTSTHLGLFRGMWYVQVPLLYIYIYILVGSNDLQCQFCVTKCF